jgi:phosphate starvation-inducible PhoH-like protein
MLQIPSYGKALKHPLKRLDTQPSAYSITLEPNDARRLASLCGQFDENLRLIEQRLNVEIR